MIRGADKKIHSIGTKTGGPSNEEKCSRPGASCEQDDHLNRPIHNVLSSTSSWRKYWMFRASQMSGGWGGWGVWGAGATHPWLGERQNVKRRWWRQKGGFQGQSITAGREGVNLIAPGGEEEERRTRKRRHCGGSRRDGLREERRIWEGVGRDRARGVSTVGRWERLLALNVLLQFPKQRK